MVRILAGETAADEGEIAVDGAPWSSSIGWQRVAVVHQEPQLFPNLTVAENIVVGREGTPLAAPRVSSSSRSGCWATWASMRSRTARSRPCRWPSSSAPRSPGPWPSEARVFLFDEPNSALTDEESDDLFRRMHALAGAGRVVILVSPPPG